jgi:hypothetical protein
VSWYDLVLEVVRLAEEARATHLGRDADGRLVMPSAAELVGSRDVADKLLEAACKADPEMLEAIGVACANAVGVDQERLRSVLGRLT